MFDAMMKAIITLTLFGATFADNCNPYTQIKPGVITYEVDDGGCFFCGKFPQSQFPLEGDDLAHHCKQMCDADPTCISFAVARSPVLHAVEYHWGSTANCCLDRTVAPAELWVDGHDVDPKKEPNECQMEAMCWTRFERNKVNCDITEEPSGLCEVVWKGREFTEDEIHDKIDFVTNGCPFGGDKEFEQMMQEAYHQCKAEVDEELGNFNEFEGGQ